MTTRTLTSFVALLFVAVAGVSAQDTADQTEDEATISWLTDQLQGQAYLVQSQGDIRGGIAADESARLILNSDHIVDAYYFRVPEQAASISYQLSGSMPYATVHVQDGLIVVSHDARALSLRRDLSAFLGAHI